MVGLPQRGHLCTAAPALAFPGCWIIATAAIATAAAATVAAAFTVASTAVSVAAAAVAANRNLLCLDTALCVGSEWHLCRW